MGHHLGRTLCIRKSMNPYEPPKRKIMGQWVSFFHRQRIQIHAIPSASTKLAAIGQLQRLVLPKLKEKQRSQVHQQLPKIFWNISTPTQSSFHCSLALPWLVLVILVTNHSWKPLESAYVEQNNQWSQLRKSHLSWHPTPWAPKTYMFRVVYGKYPGC